ncbi:hypothetical protein QTP88_022426 [Uroleucon formosanum]
MRSKSKEPGINSNFSTELQIVIREIFVVGMNAGPIQDGLLEENSSKISITYSHLMEISAAKESTINNKTGWIKKETDFKYQKQRSTYSSLAFYLARGANTINQIISETTKKIWECLVNEYIPIPTEEKWMGIANQYSRLWNLPNCVGSIGGKHIRIPKVPNTGSTNFNYKTYHSIVLMACSDADGNFIMIETGFTDRNSDGIF